MRIRATLIAALAVALVLVVSASADAFVYWTASDGVGRAGLDGSAATSHFVGGTGGAEVNGLAVDGAHIYVANSESIMRANLNGSGSIQPSFIPNLSGAIAVAVDGAHIYFASSDGIGRANLDGSGVNTHFVDPGGGAEGVAVDGASIYWTKRNTAYSGRDSIGRANLDGSGADPNFIVPSGCPTLATCTISAPWGIAVDSGSIYWTNLNPRSIARAGTDGGAATKIITNLRAEPWYIAASGGALYWAEGAENSSVGTIARAAADGSGINEDLVTGVAAPRGVAIDALTSAPSGTTPTGALALKLGRAGRQVLKSTRSMGVTIGCNLACTALVGARVVVKGRVVATWSRSIPLAATTWAHPHGVRFPLKTKTYTSLRKALRAHKRVRLIVAVAATDGDQDATRNRTWTVALH